MNINRHKSQADKRHGEVRHCLLLICLCLFFFQACTPGYKLHIEAMKDRIESDPKIGYARLRRWAENLIEQNSTNLMKTNQVDLNIDQVPPWLATLGDPFPLVAFNIRTGPGVKSEYVSIGWFSGRGGGALEVGTTNYGSM